MLTEQDVSELRRALNKIWVFQNLYDFHSALEINILYGNNIVNDYSKIEEYERDYGIDISHRLATLAQQLLGYKTNEVEPEIAKMFYYNLCFFLDGDEDFEHLEPIRVSLQKRAGIGDLELAANIVTESNPYQNYNDVYTPDYRVFGQLTRLCHKCNEFQSFVHYEHLYTQIKECSYPYFLKKTVLTLKEVELSPRSYFFHMLATNYNHRFATVGLRGVGEFIPYILLYLARTNRKYTMELSRICQSLPLGEKVISDLEKHYPGTYGIG